MIAQIAAATTADLESCDSEPIQSPGAIQPHGTLVVADATDLRVTHVGANFETSTGMSSRRAIGSPLAELIGADAMADVSDALAGEHYV